MISVSQIQFRRRGDRGCKFSLGRFGGWPHLAVCLAANLQKMFETGEAPYPVQRTLLVSGILQRAFESLDQGSVRLETPELDVSHSVGPESHHARA